MCNVGYDIVSTRQIINANRAVTGQTKLYCIIRLTIVCHREFPLNREANERAMHA